MPRLIREPVASPWRRGLTTGRRLQALARDCRGALLIEAVIAVLVFTVIGAAVLFGLRMVHTSSFNTEKQSTAENIARNQMEYMLSLPYQEPPSTYPTVSVPQGYGVTCQAQEYGPADPSIERVVVTVTFDGAQQLVLETLRAR